jgi:hypothetical protein
MSGPDFQAIADRHRGRSKVFIDMQPGKGYEMVTHQLNSHYRRIA